MDKKLTLSLNQSIIENAKIYAKSNNTSLSKLIESYLATLTKETKKKSEITPLVKSLSGVIELPSDFDEKEAYYGYLMDKYK
ncbi:hypothetical protein J8281_10235 [Aquimarina sp. U1-2]|uniref:DUF6364 family protein n=1 Tax=Aquimarina sp. U1-2 TaxID=2823141 RepID=UPI001AECAE6F|nr:DUF6364 family protein [Aquimarina sp. U1-2]MBP2832562.1 hypothetical protein [Aquimarina sp. U1-2]